MNRLLVFLLAAPAATIAQPTVTEAQRIENLCRLRPDSPVCQARLQGQAAAGKLDLGRAGQDRRRLEDNAPDAR